MRIFGADIDIALIRRDGVPGNHHAFDQHERIAFHDHPVGKGAAVPLLGVADDVLAIAPIFVGVSLTIFSLSSAEVAILAAPES